MNRSSMKLSYAGQDRFHQHQCASTNLLSSGRGGQKAGQDRQTSAVPAQLVRQLTGYFPKANLLSAHEAGFSGSTYIGNSEEAGIEN